MSSVCTLDHFTCAPSSYRAFLGGCSISRTNFDCIWFVGDLPGAPAPLCDHGLYMFEKKSQCETTTYHSNKPSAKPLVDLTSAAECVLHTLHFVHKNLCVRSRQSHSEVLKQTYHSVVIFHVFTADRRRYEGIMRDGDLVYNTYALLSEGKYDKCTINTTAVLILH